MKKLLFALLLLVSAYAINAQTVSEITNILNTKPQSVTTVAATTTNDDLIAALDLTTSGYRAVSIQIKGTWTGTVTFQGSNDNFTTTDNILAYSPTAGTWSTSTTSNGTFIIPSLYGKIRVRATTVSSGTINSVAYGFLNNVTFPYSNNTTAITGSVTANAGTNLNTSLLALESGGNLATIAGKDFATQTTLSALNTKIPSNLTVTSTRLLVDGSGVTQPVSISGNQAVNVAQINGVTPLMGAGNTGTGSQRVTIASDQAALPVTKSGTWDITNAGTFAVQPASSTAPVSTMNSASANSGLNSATAFVFDDVSPTAITENSFGFGRMSSNRNQYVQLRDNAGNERGLNIDANGALAATVTNATAANLKMDLSGSAANTTAGLLSVKIDQTTVGTTNAFSLAQLGANTVATGNGASSTGVLRVAQVNDGTGVIATVSTVTNLSQLGGSAIAMNTGTRSAGTQRVTIATDDIVPASQSGTWTVQPGNTANTTAWLTANTPVTSGGLTTYHLVSAGSTNATSVKASAGQLYGYYIFNANASARKVAFHNTSGTPTAGSSIFFSIVIPASSGANVEFANGIAFSSGIGITTVTGTADNDATGVASGDLIINLFYK